MNPEIHLDGMALGRRSIADGRLTLYVPVQPDAFLDELDREVPGGDAERGPYFATLWPAGEVLVEAVLDGLALVGRTVLDLGCGVGAAGLAAGLQGAEVTFFDWEPRALGIAALSARTLGLASVRFVEGDWLEPPALGRFDRILAADVLYESGNVAAVASFLSQHLTERGEAWVADPRRVPAEAFPEALVRAGLVITHRTQCDVGPRAIRVDLLRVTYRDPRP